MKHLATFALCLAAAGAHAQTVYRCGSAYSESPCPQATRVDVADPRSAEQRAEAQRVAAEDKQLGQRMQQERLALLASQKPAGATSLSGPAAKPAERTRAKKLKWPKKAQPKPAPRPKAPAKTSAS